MLIVQQFNVCTNSIYDSVLNCQAKSPFWHRGGNYSHLKALINIPNQELFSQYTAVISFVLLSKQHKYKMFVWVLFFFFRLFQRGMIKEVSTTIKNILQLVMPQRNPLSPHQFLTPKNLQRNADNGNMNLHLGNHPKLPAALFH